MKRLVSTPRWVLLVLLLALLATIGGGGCSTTESENYSARPWNAPKSWENGLPSALSEGR